MDTVYFHTPTPTAKEIFLYPLCIGYYKCDQNYRVERNSYDSFLLMYIKNGHGYVQTNNTRHTLVPSQVMLLNCYQPHIYGAVEHLEFYWVHFDGSKASGYFHYLLSCQKFPVILNAARAFKMEKLFQILLSALSASSLAEIQYDKYLTDMLALIAEGFVPNDAPGKLSPADGTTSSVFACQQAAGYMRQKFHTSMTIEEIASRVSLSPYYFVRCFKKQYGVTPHQYLISLRINSAQFYLRSTRKTIREIAFLCGFQSENNFCIAFKKQVGITPTHYRESL